MRLLRNLLIVVVVLAGLALVADRVGAWAASRVVADQVEQELANYDVQSAPPEVTVTGFPFLTQVAEGRYEAVDVLLRDVGANDVRLPTVDLTASGVRAPARNLMERQGPITADRVTGTAVITYDSVVNLTGVEGLHLSPNGDGSVRVRMPAELVGVRMELEGSAEVTVAGQAVQLQVRDLGVVDADPPPGLEALVSQLTTAISIQVDLPALPYGLTVEDVSAESNGLAVTLTATDVPLVS